LSEVMPEFEQIADRARKGSKRLTPVQITKTDSQKNSHILQASASSIQSEGGSVVITFDDVTEMVAAQRNAAWSDIARRIAHEIKNPLTPIQLSAERLQSKYGEAVGDDGGVFRQCTDTIIRQVGDIGNMVDEFAAFARMPEVAFKKFEATDIVSHTVFLQRVAHPNVQYVFETRDEVMMYGDPRQLSQALTNVLKNAEEALSRLPEDSKDLRIEITIEQGEDIRFMICDTGPGWPENNRYALLEPRLAGKQSLCAFGTLQYLAPTRHGARLINCQKSHG